MIFVNLPVQSLARSTDFWKALGFSFNPQFTDENDSMVDAALANGGSPAGEAQDFGYMYGRSFLDPDGHHWDVTWMDLSAAPAG